MNEEEIASWIVLAEHGDSDVARMLEDEIERRGLEEEYARAMMRIIYQVGFKNYAHSQYLLIRATPEQRAKAFREAINP